MYRDHDAAHVPHGPLQVAFQRVGGVMCEPRHRRGALKCTTNEPQVVIQCPSTFTLADLEVLVLLWLSPKLI